ncbi:SPOR domain-containing protein [Reinekea sp. G2M2-21]|uniref:SPOR domain-containing protein n=1 Tax=Reinekea sp. G2M2-21 TaxID=2788942 RepID=UPI0018AAD48D|nr:AAA family ATPase [Reinekea sp. G2M2-21]
MDLSEQSERMQSFYNLKHDPFGSVVDAMVFSGAGGRYETAETIRHLLNYSHQDSLLVGHSGSGKRTLALQVLKLLEDQWRVAWIDGSENQSSTELIKEIIGQLGLGLKVSESNESLLSQIADVVSSRYQDEESFLIVVQFADLLPVESLETLQQIRELADPVDYRVRQLWLSDHWAQLGPLIDESDWYVHPLEPFSDTDAEQYLKDRLVAAGNVGESLFAQKDVARLNQLSDGNPANLNEAARDYLIGSTFKTTERKFSFPLPHAIAGIAALSLVVIAILYQTNENKTESVPLLTEKPVQDMTEVEKKLAEAIAKVEAKQTVEIADPSPVEVATIGETEGQASVKVPSSEEVADEPTTEQGNEETVPEVSESAPDPVATDIPAAGLLAKGADTEFTIQLIGVREREKLQQLIPAFSDSKMVDIVQTTYQGKPWFVLIYGQFPDKASAQASVPNIPAEVGVKEPWIRSFKSLRDSI